MGAQAAAEPQKQVLALQAFTDAGTEREILRLSEASTGIPGVDLAFRWGAVPHITLAAWRVSGEELAQIRTRFRAEAARWAPATVTAVHPGQKVENDQIWFFLLPTPEAEPALQAWRTALLDRAAIQAEDFAQRSGKAWWPHLTLWALPSSQVLAAEGALHGFAGLRELRLCRLALVGFEEGIHTLETAELREPPPR